MSKQAAPQPELDSRSRSVRVTEFEGLRGILAWWVVSGHLLVLAGIDGLSLPKPFRLLLRGDMPVNVFIILSGFVISMLIDKGRDTYPAYITRRFFRLFPAYLCCLAAMIPLSILGISAMQSLPWAGDRTISWIIADWHSTQAHLWAHLAAHLTMLHGIIPNEILPDSPGAILGPAWSVSLEWQFYLVAPLCLALMRRSLAWLSVCAILTTIATLGAKHFGNIFEPGLIITYPFPGFLPLKAVYFFCGICSFIIHKDALRYLRSGTLARVLLVIFAGLIVFTHSADLFLWFFVFGLHIFHTNSRQNWLSRSVRAFLNSVPMQWLGRVSYSTYLCHAPVLYLALWLLADRDPSWTNWRFLTWLTAISVPVVLLVSEALFRFIERPAILAAKSWVTTWSPHPETTAAPLTTASQTTRWRSL